MSTTFLSPASSVPTDDTNTTHSTDAVRQVPLCQIFANPYQPRRHFDEDALLELAESIRQHGVLQPILLRQTAPEQYELIAGERRSLAAQLAGLTTIPAVIKATTEREQAELALIENLQRENLSPVETARAFQTLMQQFGMTQKDIAQRVGKDPASISHCMQMLKLPEEIMNSLERGEIQEGHALALLQVEEETRRADLWREVVAGQLSVRETRKRARTGDAEESEPVTAPCSPVPQRPATALQQETSPGLPVGTTDPRMQELLAQRFERRVMIRHSFARGGTIEIGFHDETDLFIMVNRLLSLPV